MNLSSTIIFLTMILLFCKTDVIQAYLKFEIVDNHSYEKLTERDKIITDINQSLQKVAPYRKCKNGKYYVVEKSYKNLLPLTAEQKCLAIGTVLKEPLSCNPALIKNITNHELQQYLIQHEQPILYEIKKFFL
ncbi:MAG: hypothetical protein ACXWL5_01150 [Candidatus Chromulinivorax sp.]